MYRVKFFTLILILSVSCKHYSDNDYLQGMWKYLDRITLTFENDQHYEWQSINNIYFSGTYVLNPENDSITFFTQYDFTLEFKYRIAGNKLIIWSYKPEKNGQSTLIDDILTFENKRSDLGKTKPFKENKTKDIFLIPLDFTGNVYVSYDSQVSANTDNPDSEVRKIPIKENGLASTEFKESVISYGLSDFEFMRGNRILPYVEDAGISGRKIDELRYKNLFPDSVYACIYGFNQLNRDSINKIFNSDVEGNVFMFCVDTLKNIIASNRYN